MTTLFLIRHGLTAVTGKTLYGRTPGVAPQPQTKLVWHLRGHQLLPSGFISTSMA